MEAEAREIVKAVIEELAKSDPKGAGWDKVVEELTKRGLARNQIDDDVLELLDNGQVIEERMGYLKPKKGLLDW